MHVITRKRLLDAAARHPQHAGALNQWYRVIKKAQVADFATLRRLFNSVDKVGGLYVFNVGGNHLRLIAAIHFNRQKIYLREVLTHREYDENQWKR